MLRLQRFMWEAGKKAPHIGALAHMSSSTATRSRLLNNRKTILRGQFSVTYASEPTRFLTLFLGAGSQTNRAIRGRVLAC